MWSKSEEKNGGARNPLSQKIDGLKLLCVAHAEADVLKLVQVLLGVLQVLRDHAPGVGPQRNADRDSLPPANNEVDRGRDGARLGPRLTKLLAKHVR